MAAYSVHIPELNLYDGHYGKDDAEYIKKDLENDFPLIDILVVKSYDEKDGINIDFNDDNWISSRRREIAELSLEKLSKSHMYDGEELEEKTNRLYQIIEIYDKARSE